MRVVELPEPSDLEGVDATKRDVLWAMADRARVQLLALQGEIANQVEQNKAYRADGHKSATEWMVASRSWSRPHARTCLQVGRMMVAMPAVRAAMFAGRIGVDQVTQLAFVFANPRCGHRLAGYQDKMLRHAQRKPFEDFRNLLRRWEHLADPLGAFKDLDKVREGRGVRTGSACGAFRLEAFGPALAGEQIGAVLDAFAQAEFDADWTKLVAEVGADKASVSLLARTHLQRRFDALWKVCMTAAASSKDVKLPETLVNVVTDHETFERGLVRLFGGDPGPDDPSRFESATCRTVDGVDLDPRDVALAALLGHVRRVLWTAPGLPTEVGVKRRCFTGAARAAVEFLSTHCVHTGCSTRASVCQIDHLLPASHGGPTAGWNGGPKCGPQNRFTWRAGFRTRRDVEGNWHTARPDGTELGPTDWWDTS